MSAPTPETHIRSTGRQNQWTLSAFGDKWHMSASSDRAPGSLTPPAIAAVIVAAGSGSRMQGDCRNSFSRCVANQCCVTVLMSLPAMQRWWRLSSLAQQMILPAFVRALGTERMGDHRLRIVAGGTTRQQSVMQDWPRLPAGQARLVGIHDAARPLVSHAVIDRLATAISDDVTAALPVLAVTDTLKSAEAGRISGTIDRSNVWTAQTPQTFDLVTIARLHEENDGMHPVTDDISLAEDAGLRIATIKGDRRLMKLTHEDDLAMLMALQEMGQLRGMERWQKGWICVGNGFVTCIDSPVGQDQSC